MLNFTDETVGEVEDLSNPEYRARHKHEFGRRLLIHLVEDRAKRGHSRPIARIPKGAHPKDGFHDVDYPSFVNAINRSAWWMKENVPLDYEFEPLIYVGAFDLRYYILAMAAVKTGHVMFLISARNSLEAQLSLIDDAKVNKIMVSAGSTVDGMVQPVLQHRPLLKFVVPELAELLDNTPAPAFTFTGTWEQYHTKPWLLLHTSGSTGMPKVIPIKHGYAASFDAYWNSPNENELFVHTGQKRVFMPFPPFHMGGIIANLAGGVFVDATIVFPPLTPLSADVVNDIIVNAQVEFCNLPPFILIELVKNKEYAANLECFKSISYGGGPLPQEIGDQLNSLTKVISLYGSTEMCLPSSLIRPQKYWKYFRFDTVYNGIEFRPIDNTDFYEFVVVRNPALGSAQAIFYTFPELAEFHSKDLFSKHPTEPELWKYEGRLDDLIVFNNAEKLNPVAMEGTITSFPEVKGALIVGSGRFQAALLLEVENPPSTFQEQERLLNEIWPYVQKANEQCPAYARITRELIRINQADKSFVRAGKGTIQRFASVQLFAPEIDDLYALRNGFRSPETITPPSFLDVNKTQKFLHDWIMKETRIGDLNIEQDFFNSGMDSLDVVNLARLLSQADHKISVEQLYSNPNIGQLAHSLKRMNTESEIESSSDEQTLRDMQQLFTNLRLQESLENVTRTSSLNDTVNEDGGPARHVIVIGTTGSLGPYLLDELLKDPTVRKVTCLNRSKDAVLRQAKKHAACGLNTDFQSSRVEFVTCDLLASNLGLLEIQYRQLQQSVTHIIHNAWIVNFNQHVTSFRPVLEGVRSVIKFTRNCSPRKPRLFFMSSVSIADKIRAELKHSDQIPEGLLKDWGQARLGYGQSKLIAEGLIADAAIEYNMDVAICRLCQLGGPVQHGTFGEWTKAEWIPSLVLSSKAMSIVPQSLGPMDMVDWLPIDLTAKICIELLFTRPDSSPGIGKVRVSHQPQSGPRTIVNGTSTHNSPQMSIWHVVNPHPTLWSQLVSSILPFMGNSAKTVDFVQWVEALEDHHRRILANPNEEGGLSAEKVPSIKLLNLFKLLKDQAIEGPTPSARAVFETQKTVKNSPTLAQMPAVGSEWMNLWMQQWEF